MNGKFKSNLKDIIYDYNIPVQEISEETGISESSLYRYMNNDIIPPVDKAILIANYLEYSVEEIWYYSGSKK